MRINPVDTALIGYGINLTGTQNINKSLTFLFSQKINNVENYILMKGARCETFDCEITAEGTVDVTMAFACREITVPSPTAGVTTPTYATPTNPAVWTNVGPGTQPLTINALPYDVSRFSFSVTNNCQLVKFNGDVKVAFIEPTNREITFAFDAPYKDNVLQADVTSLTGRTATYKLTGATQTPANVTATFGNFYLERYSTALSPTANEVQMASFEGVAQTVSVA